MPLLLDHASQDTQSQAFLWPATREGSRIGAIEVKAVNFGAGNVQIQASTDQIIWITLEDDSGPVLFTSNRIKLFQLPSGIYLRAILIGANNLTSQVSAGVY